MTIVFLSPRFYPQIGGVEKHAFEIAKKLAKKHKVVVITEGDKNKKESFSGIKVIKLFFGKNDWFEKFIIWKRILDYRKLIEKADIVHCHDVFFWYLPLRIIYPRKKVYITFHGYETVFPVSAKSIFIRKLSEKLTSGNICVGNYIKKWYGTKPDFVIYGGVNSRGPAHSAVFTPVSEASSSLRSSVPSARVTPRILFIGRIEKDTGVEIYSEVLKRLKNYEFEVCGDGTLRSVFEKFGKVHGFVRNLNSYIRKADIIFASSYLSIMEGMVNRKPVFSVFNNRLKEDYLKMTPFKNWIIIERSPKILTKKIRLIMRNKKLREKNINLSYNWVKDQTWDKIVKEYLELWNGSRRII